MFKKLFKRKLSVQFLSLTLSVSLIITSLQGLAFAVPAAVNVLPAVMQPERINTNIIPFNIGRVTETTYNGDGKVLVLIQDLHSHKQTQENINAILNVLDKKYGIKNIWLEGASGELNTGWLSTVRDKAEREKIIQLLLENGRLTGAELFSVRTNRPEILKGLENRDVYLTNFDRLKEIHNKREEIEAYIPKIKAILNAKIEKYFSRENKKINVLRKNNINGKINSEKYFRVIFKASKKAKIDLSRYEQISKYIYVSNKLKDINFNKVNKEIKELLAELKNLLPYQRYTNLVNKVNNKESETEFYVDIKNFADEKGLSGKYKYAEKFFEYLTYREMLNPIELAEQEEELINEIQINFAQTGYEKDVLFLKKYFGLLESYLNNKITADEYGYFENNKEKFKTLWAKYVDIDGIININKYFDLFEEFYGDNVERNRYFIENITGVKPETEKNTIIIKAPEQYNAKAVEELSKEKDGIDVLIAGGFHTRGLSKLFDEEKINYIVITPNVTSETVTSDKLYENMFAEEYEIVKEKFANIPTTALIREVINKAGSIESIREDNGVIELVTKKGTIKLGTDGTINGKILKGKKNDGNLSQEQAEIAAEAFINLQEYLKKVRENKRRKTAGKKTESLKTLKTKIAQQINKIDNKVLAKAFKDKLGTVPGSKKRLDIIDKVLITIIFVSGITSILYVPTHNLYSRFRTESLREDIVAVTTADDSSSEQEKNNTLRLKALVSALESNKILSMTKHEYVENNNISVMKKFLDKNFLRIYLNDKFVDYCEYEELPVIEQYNLAINFLRQINTVFKGDLSDLPEEIFDDIIVETVSYYNEVAEIAKEINVLDGDTAVFGIHARNAADNGVKRFSSRGMRRILEILNITPYAFDALELYDTESVSDKKNIEDFFDKIINFDKYGKEKGLFIFDGHGTNNRFIYGKSENFYYFDSFTAEEFANVLIKANNNGVDLRTKVFVFQDCHSDEFSKKIINKLQSAGIENLPVIIIGTSEETKIAYSVPVSEYEYDKSSEKYYVSSLEYSIIEYLQNLPREELEQNEGHLTLWQIAVAPMRASNHTVYLSSPKIEQLNNEYAKKLRELTEAGDDNLSDEQKYTALQSEKTINLLIKIAKTLKLKNPEQFRYSSLGVAVGVISETVSFFKFFDTASSPSFEKQHRNLTAGQRAAIWIIRILTVSSAVFVFLNPVSNILIIPVAILTESITHFIYNEFQLLIGNNKKMLQTDNDSVEESKPFELFSSIRMLFLKIKANFKVKAEVIAVVDVNDEKAIREATETAERGIKVKLIILNSETGNITDETGKILDIDGTEKVFELSGVNDNLEIIKYEAVDGKKIAGRAVVPALLTDIKNGSLISRRSKKVLYISPSLIDGQEDVVDGYINTGVLLATGSRSIKGALVKGLLNYGNVKTQALSDMVIRTGNIFGNYKIDDITDAVLDDLNAKGISNVMTDVSGKTEAEIIEKINLIKSKNMQVVIYGDNAESLQIKGIETVAYNAPKKGQRIIIDYGTEIAYGTDLTNVIINVAKKDGENIILTPDIIKRFIVMGASIAFDGEVLREVSRESTAENGITMLEIIKAMFVDTPEEKARKKKNAGVRAARKLNKVNVADIDKLTGYIKILRRIDIEKIPDISYRDFIYDIIESSNNKSAVYDIRHRLFEKIDRYELLGILEGLLQIIESEKIMPDIKDVDVTDNMNELLAMLAEYRLLTGKSYDRQSGSEVVKVLGDKGHYEILRELRDILKEEDISDEDKTFAVSGIIEILLLDNLRVFADIEKMFDTDIKNLHALLSAA